MHLHISYHTDHRAVRQSGLVCQLGKNRGRASTRAALLYCFLADLVPHSSYPAKLKITCCAPGQTSHIRRGKSAQRSSHTQPVRLGIHLHATKTKPERIARVSEQSKRDQPSADARETGEWACCETMHEGIDLYFLANRNQALLELHWSGQKPRRSPAMSALGA